MIAAIKNGNKIRTGAFFKSSIVFCLAAIGVLLFSSVYALAAAKMQDQANPVFISTSISKKNIYAGEAFTVTYRLHFCVPVTDPQTPLDFVFKDAYFEEYPNNAQTNTELIDGKQYQVMVVRKLLLIAYNPGSFVIPPVSLKLKINGQPNADDFFGPDKAVVKKISSQTQSINILPLPAKNDTVGFTGAVGNFAITTNFDKITGQTNILKVIVNITGSGSLKGAKFSPPKLPPGIDVFNEKHTDTHQLTEDGFNTTHVYEFSLTANYKNNYNIGPVSFVYFNPVTSQYVKYTSAAYNWSVDIGPPMAKQTASVSKPVNIKNLQMLYTANKLEGGIATHLFFRSFYCYVFLLSTLMILITGLAYGALKKDRLINQAYYDYKKAKRRAIKDIGQLKTLTANMDAEIFSKKLVSIFYKYLSDKNIVTDGEQTLNNIIFNLQQLAIPLSTIQQTRDFISAQYKSRFWVIPDENYDKEQHRLMLLQIINTLDNYDKVNNDIAAHH